MGNTIMSMDDSQLWTRKLLKQLRRTITPYVYISESTEKHVSIGVQIQDVIPDHGKYGTSMRFICLDNVARYDRSSGTSRKFNGPTRKEFIKQARNKYLSIIDVSQRALLPSMYARLVNVPEVSLSMSPLRKILIYLEEMGSMTPDKLGRRLSPAEKSRNYFSLLEDLNYIEREDGYYVPGREMKSLQTAMIQPPELYERILGDIIQQRPKYLQEVLHWTMIVPYLRWSNAYYLPSYEVGRILTMERSDFVRNYRRFYDVTHDDVTEINQMQRIVDAKALYRVNGYYQGEEKIFENFSRVADKEPVLEPLRVASA